MQKFELGISDEQFTEKTIHAIPCYHRIFYYNYIARDMPIFFRRQCDELYLSVKTTFENLI